MKKNANKEGSLTLTPTLLKIKEALWHSAMAVIRQCPSSSRRGLVSHENTTLKFVLHASFFFVETVTIVGAAKLLLSSEYQGQFSDGLRKIFVIVMENNFLHGCKNPTKKINCSSSKAQFKSADRERTKRVNHGEIPKAEQDENKHDLVSKDPAQGERRSSEKMKPVLSDDDYRSSCGSQSSSLTSCEPYPWPPMDSNPMAYMGVWEPWRLQISPEERAQFLERVHKVEK